jgi:hypothetical protein
MDGQVAITNLLYTLNGTIVQQQGTNSQCCAAVVAALNSLQAATTAAIAAIPTPVAPVLSIDLTPIVTTLTALQNAIAIANAEEALCCTKIDADLRAIAAALPSSINIQPIADAINKQSTLQDIPQALLDKLQADGAILPGYGQFLTGGPWSISDIVSKFTEYAEVVIDAVAGFDAAPGTMGPTDKKVFNEIASTITSGLKWFAKYLGLPADSFDHFLKALFGKYISANDAVIEPILSPLITALTGQLKPTGGATPTLGNVFVDPDKPVATAAGVALTAAIAAWVASMVKEGTGEPLKKMIELIAGLIGFEELRDVTIAPLIRHGLAAVGDMNARALFRQHLPKGEDAATWMARGLITPAFGKQLLNYDGFGDQITPAATAAAYEGIRAFQLIRLFQTGLFQSADIQDELTFLGMRPASQTRMQLAAPYIATETERKALQTALESAYTAGLLTDAELTAQLDSADQNTNRDNLILTAAKWKKLIAVTKDLEAEYTTMFKAGLLTDAAYRSFLSGIGLQSDMVDAIAAKAEAQANATLQKKELAQAAALARATASEERKTAMKGYATGKTNEAELILALSATGLTPVQAAAWAGLAALQQVGNLRWVYGLQLNPPAAALLRERVSALSAQREKELLTDPQFTTQLSALGIPQPWLNAIRAHANALIALSTTAAPVLVPLQTAS